MDDLKTRIRNVPDFPKAGILFYDVTTLLRDAVGFKLAIDTLAAPYLHQGISLVVGSRAAAILGAPVADRIRAGFVPVGSWASCHPRRSAPATRSSAGPTASRCTATPSSAAKVLIIDDLLATGGTARATVDLVRQLGGDVYGVGFLVSSSLSGTHANLQGKRRGNSQY